MNPDALPFVSNGVRWLAVLLACALSARGSEVGEVERRIKKEPTYKTKKPRYALLVLGEAAKAKVWLVWDGDVLYVDRNGNGDLTENGEQVALKRSGHWPQRLYNRMWDFRAGDLPQHGAYWGLNISISSINTRYEPTHESARKLLASVRGFRAPCVASIRLKRGAERTQFASTLLGESPATAPVLHFDGELTVGILEPIGGFEFKRRGEAVTLKVGVGSSGPGGFAFVWYDELLPDARPTAVVEFPSKVKGRRLPPRRIKLTGKC